MLHGFDTFLLRTVLLPATNMMGIKLASDMKAVSEAVDRLSREQKLTLAGVGTLLTGYALFTLLRSKSRPVAFELTGGSIARENVAKEFKE